MLDKEKTYRIQQLNQCVITLCKIGFKKSIFSKFLTSLGKMVVWQGLKNSWEKKWKAKKKGKDIANKMQSSRELQGKIRKPS